MKYFDGKVNNYGGTDSGSGNLKNHSDRAVEHYHETVNHMDMEVDDCDSG